VSRENVEIVRRGIEYFLRTDEHLWETIDSEVEIHEHDLPDAGVYHGHAGWLKWEDHFDSTWEDLGVDPEEFIDAGDDKVVTVLRLWAQGRGGISLEWRDGVVSTLRDGKIVRMDYYGSRTEALAAVGLSE
jgi:ketosteroid isomerase-like protein